MQQDQQSRSELERRVADMTAAMEEMNARQLEMMRDMEQQKIRHDHEKQQWQNERHRLMNQNFASNFAERNAQTFKTRPSGLLVSSRAIGQKGKANFCTRHHHNRPFQTLSDRIRAKLLEVVQEKRQFLASNYQRQKTTMEADQAAKALEETLRISDQSDQTTATSNSANSSIFPNLSTQQYLNSFECQVQDLSKRRQMQHQLASVLHAQNCSEQVDIVGNVACGMSYCSTIKKVLEHIRTCTFVTKCPTPACSLTREVMKHYKECSTNDCQICQVAMRDSLSTREQLIRFMDMMCKGLSDDEVLIKMPSMPTVNTPFDRTAGLISLGEEMSTTMFLPTSITPLPFVKVEETSMDIKMESTIDSDVHE